MGTPNKCNAPNYTYDPLPIFIPTKYIITYEQIRIAEWQSRFAYSL